MKRKKEKEKNNTEFLILCDVWRNKWFMASKTASGSLVSNVKW